MNTTLKEKLSQCEWGVFDNKKTWFGTPTVTMKKGGRLLQCHHGRLPNINSIHQKSEWYPLLLIMTTDGCAERGQRVEKMFPVPFLYVVLFLFLFLFLFCLFGYWKRGPRGQGHKRRKKDMWGKRKEGAGGQSIPPIGGKTKGKEKVECIVLYEVLVVRVDLILGVFIPSQNFTGHRQKNGKTGHTHLTRHYG